VGSLLLSSWGSWTYPNERVGIVGSNGSALSAEIGVGGLFAWQGLQLLEGGPTSPPLPVLLLPLPFSGPVAQCVAGESARRLWPNLPLYANLGKLGVSLGSLAFSFRV
jgi:hypothetical protein